MQEGSWRAPRPRCFSSVQDFWDAEDLEGQPASVWKGKFQGKLQKGLVDDGKLREFRREDLQRGIGPDTLIVLLLVNRDRHRNRERLQSPPPRTGLFAAFMDEVEEVAHAGRMSVGEDSGCFQRVRTRQTGKAWIYDCTVFRRSRSRLREGLASRIAAPTTMPRSDPTSVIPAKAGIHLPA